MPPSVVELSAEDRQALDSWVGDFDRGWKDGLLTEQSRQIPTDSAWRLRAMAEMVKIDIDRQWRRGRESHVESYLEQFPELAHADDAADLILAEFEARRQSGAPAELEGYLRRFPEHAGEIARRIAGGASSRPQHAPSSAGWSPPKSAPEVLPERLGRYKILKRLGQGGMGSVFLAEDTQLGRKVALKVPHFGPDEGPEARERFFREARTAATLDHPYLCPVFDVGEVDGRLYLTMAFIEGKSLAESLKGEGMPTRQVAALVGKLALALQQAHAKGVVHRDLKPANVMIKSDGTRREPVIVDFGLALRDDGDSRMTKSGQVMGTLAYMSPEQVMGDLNAIGPPSDIFALGVILYELLTGRLPFNGAGLAIAGQILTQRPLAPTSIRADIDPRIEAICLKAMAKKPAQRYASMADLAAALTDFLKAPAVSATESTPPKLAPSTESQGPKTSGGDRLMAEFFQGLATGDSEPRIVPKSKKPSSRSKLLEPIETDEEVEPMLAPRATAKARPPWLLPVIGVGALATLCLALILIKAMMPDLRVKTPNGTIVLKNYTEGSDVFVDGGKVTITYANSRYEITIPIGEHGVEVRKPGFKTFGEKVAVQEGENLPLIVEYEPLEALAKEESKPLPDPVIPPTPAPPPAAKPSIGLDRPTLIAEYKGNSLRADGLISPGEYDDGEEILFTAGSKYGQLFEWNDKNPTKSPEDLSVRLFASSSDKSLFLAFRVRDQFIDAQPEDADKPHHNDAVAIFIDGDREPNDFFAKTEPARGNSEGFELVADTGGSKLSVSSDFSSDQWTVKTTIEPGGYVMEFEIPLTLIDVLDGPARRTPVPGETFNLGLAIFDNDAALRQSKTIGFIRAKKGDAYPYEGGETAWTFGLKLQERPLVEKMPTVSFATPDTRPTLVAFYHPAPPVLDGLISPGEYGPGVEVDFTEGSRFGAILDRANKGIYKTPDDLSIRLYTAYTDRSLFLGFRVRDQFIDAQPEDKDRPNRNDAIELFLDGDRVANDFIAANPPHGGSEGFQIIADTLGNKHTVSSDFNSTDWKVKARQEPGGYVIEFEIALTLIDVYDSTARKQPPGPGSLIHFGLAIDDNDELTGQNNSHAFIRLDPSIGVPYYQMEPAWSLGIKLEEKPILPTASGDGWRPLHGATLAGWHPYDGKDAMANPSSVWTVRDGAILGNGGPSWIFSPWPAYRNFRIRGEVGADAGQAFIVLRAQRGPAEVAEVRCPVTDARPGQPWIGFDLGMVGDDVVGFGGGKMERIRTVPPGTPHAGHVAIETTGPDARIRLRNLEIQELDDSGNPITAANPARPLVKGATEKRGTAKGVSSKALFNGKNLIGWTVFDKERKPANVGPIWTVKDDILHGKGGASNLLSNRAKHGNFRLKAEVKINAGGNSGLFIRIPNSPYFTAGYEVQINNGGSDPIGTGSIYTAGDGKASALAKTNPVKPDTWFTIEVEAVGNRIKTFVDGKPMVDYIDTGTVQDRGYIAIQCHDAATHVQVRKVEVEDLDESGKPIVEAAAEANFRPIFNGKNLAGWKVTPSVPGIWSVKDGQIVAVSAVPKNQTWLLSDADYDDFVLRFEVHLPNPSDSGVAIRTIFGEENPLEFNLRNMAGGVASTGALRWGIESGPQEYLQPDRQASLVPEGEWNLVEVQAIAGKLQFSVNGEQILAVDTASGARQADAIPALRRGRGRIGLQAHTGTIRFRNVEIKRL